jgi:hypothetical protein
VRRRAAPLAAAAAVLLAGAGAAAGATARVSVTAVHRGTTLMVVGTGFAPPIEFCTPLQMRLDGRPARGAGRVIDDYGSYAIRLKVPPILGRHRVELRQICESGDTGATRLTSARAVFHVIP